MRSQPGWENWEGYVNAALGLTPTAGSGNQFYEKGDGVDKTDSEWAFQVESKYTEQAGFRVGKVVNNYRDQAFMAGKKFALCVRIWARGWRQPADYAIIPFEQFVALVEAAKEAERG